MPDYAPQSDWTPDQYERAKARLQNPGNWTKDKLAVLQQKIGDYEQADAFNAQAHGAGGPPAVAPTPKPRLDDAQKQGYNIDLARPDVVQNMAFGNKQAELRDKIVMSLRDDKLPTASKLKVLDSPPDYRPKAQPNPFSALPLPPKDTQYWYEPSVSEFKAALADGSLAKHLKKEFSLVDDVSKLRDEDIEDSTTFKAYKDAAWKHALAEAVKTGTPISRVEFSQQVGPVEKAQAKALDYATAAESGGLSGLSMGFADPIMRAIDPDSAEAERRARMRHPNVAMGGELAGAFSPSGAPSKLASGTAKMLGKLGLGSKGIAGVTKGVLAGATVGAVDANARAVAQAASDALDAGDSAVEAAKRIYGALDNAGDRTLHGAELGGALAGGGEVIGGAAKGLARRFVSEGGQLKDPLARGLASGVKMGAAGDPVLTPEMEAAVTRGKSQRTTADDLLTNEAADKMLPQRLQEQEGIARDSQQKTQALREKLGDATIPTHGTAQDILDMVAEVPGMTGTGKGKVRELYRFARSLRSEGKVSPKRLDDIIEEADRRAGTDKAGQKVERDPHWSAVVEKLRSLRDEFVTSEPTVNYAVRDKEGNAKPVSDYSAMKASQHRRRWMYEVENEAMGLPRKLEALPSEIGTPPDDISAQALADSVTPDVRLPGANDKAFRSAIRNSGEPDNLVTNKKIMQLAERSGVSDKLEMIKKLRDAQDWKKLLGKAISGIGVGRGGVGGSFIHTGQLLRAVPTLKSVAGGLENPGALPQFEASDKAAELVDRFLAQAVPEAKSLNVRGGQAARGTAGFHDKEQRIHDTMTPEEAQTAIAILKNVVDLGGGKVKNLYPDDKGN